MDFAVMPAFEERRRDTRFGAEALGNNARGTVRPGHAVTLVDLSRGGALVEAGRPLRPGANVHLQFERGTRRFVLPARVLRCAVWALDADEGVVYRGALRFETRCELLWEGGTRGGYGGPGAQTVEQETTGHALPRSVRRPEAQRTRGRE